MNIKSIGLASLIALAFAAQAPAARAETSKQEKTHKGEGRKMRDLNLTKEQREQIKEIRQKYKEQREGKSREEIKTQKDELKKAMGGNASASQLKALFLKVEKLKQDQAKLRFDQMLEIREVLAPEQRTKMAERFGGQKKRGHRGQHDSDEGEND